MTDTKTSGEIMNEAEKAKLGSYLESLNDRSAEQIAKTIESYLDDEAVEMFVDHIEDFYGIEDDEQLGMLTQLMVSGYVAAKELK